jgi:hypothetical protein
MTSQNERKVANFSIYVQGWGVRTRITVKLEVLADWT